jgi:Family of unknown function (DUF6444)
MLTREEVLEIYEAGSEAVISEIQRLDIIIKEQAIQINELEERVNILESRLNQDSHNSSKPSSTDFFVKKNTNFKSRRKKSDKNPGGQEGHPGTTLEMSTNVHVHRPLAVTLNETPEEFHISTGLR